jgi:acyl carrier protein
MKLTSTQLIEFIKDTLQIETSIDEQSPLFSTGELDSMSMMQLIGFVETATGTVVRPEDVTLDNFDTVERILQFASAQG